MHQGNLRPGRQPKGRHWLSPWNPINQRVAVGARAGNGPAAGDEKGRNQVTIMAVSGSENRQRPVILKARFTEQEATLVKQQADAAGLSVSALIRFALLDQKPVRASRTPPLDREMAARLLAALGPMACAMRAAAEAGDLDQLSDAVEAAQRDLSELRVALFNSLGRTP